MSTTSSALRNMRRLCYRSFAAGFVALCGMAAISCATVAHADMGTRSLSGHVPVLAAQSVPVGNIDPGQTISVTLSLPLRNEAQLDALIERIYTPQDPLFHQYLTPAQFTAQFGPTQADYDAVAAYVQGQGLTITNRFSNRSLLSVTGRASKIQKAFGVQLKNYQDASGRVFYAPTADPVLPTDIANKLDGIVGLDNSVVLRSYHRLGKRLDPVAFLNPQNAPNPTGLTPFGLTPNGSVPNGIKPNGGSIAGYYAPNDIKKAYNLDTVTQDGTGQVLALFELDGYTASDITAYEQQFGLPNVPLQDVFIDGAVAGPSGSGGDVEVELDMELMIALAPKISKLIIYQAPNSLQGLVDTYTRIAADNAAKAVSTSWGLPELYAPQTMLNAENKAFKQMATQGQTIFGASGDAGAYADYPWAGTNATISVQDPSSQPYLTSVGGTTLTTTNNSRYISETTWNGGSPANGGGGGGISQVWPQPFYQKFPGVITPRAQASRTMRNTPDVSLNSDPATGYVIYYGDYYGFGGFYAVGGTSCAAPLWAAFTALLNQARAANTTGLPQQRAPIGFITPQIYALGVGKQYGTTMHDIQDNSTNLFYPAVRGYDLATGWGSFNGANLLNYLIPAMQEAQILGNSDFEKGYNYAPWVVTSSAIMNNSPAFPANSGYWKAVLGNSLVKHTDKLYQTIAIDPNYRAAFLTCNLYFWTGINPSTKWQDSLTILVRDQTNTQTLGTLQTWTSKAAGTGYESFTYDLSAYTGKTIIIMFQYSQSSGSGMTVLVDDVTLDAL